MKKTKQNLKKLKKSYKNSLKFKFTLEIRLIQNSVNGSISIVLQLHLFRKINNNEKKKQKHFEKQNKLNQSIYDPKFLYI